MGMDGWPNSRKLRQCSAEKYELPGEGEMQDHDRTRMVEKPMAAAKWLSVWRWTDTVAQFSKTEAIFGSKVRTTGRRRDAGPWVEGRVSAEAGNIQAEP
jgi:hypothetical protein